jgi:hypothetical protein
MKATGLASGWRTPGGASQVEFEQIMGNDFAAEGMGPAQPKDRPAALVRRPTFELDGMGTMPQTDTDRAGPRARVSRRRRCFMHKLLVAGLAAVATVAALTPAAADIKPYCARYTDQSTNCGFPTLWACQAAVSAVGGFCGINPYWAAQWASGYRSPPPPGRTGRAPPPNR